MKDRSRKSVAEMARISSIITGTLVALFIIAALLANAPLTESLTENIQSTGDTYIYSADPGKNYGTKTKLKVSEIDVDSSKALIKFDISSIPTEATILSATLKLTVSSASASSVVVSVYRVTTNWLESEATWNNATASTPWTTPGGDYTGPAYNCTVAGISGEVAVWDVTDIVRYWHQNGGNYGFLLKIGGAANATVEFYSEESAALANRPVLEVEYALWHAVEAIINTTITSTASWSPVETWSGAVNVPPAPQWTTVESWSGTVVSTADWEEIDIWAATVTTSVEWQNVEIWTGTISAPPHEYWREIEVWLGSVNTSTNWMLVENWSETASAPTAWQQIENWAITMTTTAQWQQVEAWSEAITTSAAWLQVESWGTIVNTPAIWEPVESWTATLSAPAAWRVVESWSGNVTTPTLPPPPTIAPTPIFPTPVPQPTWNIIEEWSSSINAVGEKDWHMVESWSGTVSTPAVVAPVPSTYLPILIVAIILLLILFAIVFGEDIKRLLRKAEKRRTLEKTTPGKRIKRVTKAKQKYKKRKTSYENFLSRSRKALAG